ncbi:hypothetical protein [Streptomyces sp. C10-9-1]|uniref:hypothetical protein n=1 Tax=Streptomyces sp. C10-9-1 TaxID=1859285 RepID=UPI003D748E8D
MGCSFLRLVVEAPVVEAGRAAAAPPPCRASTIGRSGVGCQGCADPGGAAPWMGPGARETMEW